jgi:S1-C subfamily serine protease
MHGMLESSKQSLLEFSAVVYDGRDEIAYGVVVEENGYVVTKASEVGEAKHLKLRIGGTQYDSVQIVATDPAWDVCLLKVDAAGLKVARFAENSQIEQGTWVITNGATTRSERRPLLGIISANSREIRAEGGAVLGIEIKDEKSGLVIGDVPENSGAYRAGLRKGDKILKIADQKISKRADVPEVMKDRRVGEKISVVYLRNGKESTVEVELMGRADTFGAEQSRNDAMSGDYSKRRSGFPRVLQHDVQGNRQTIGGPLLDLDGRCIGMNIARANRAESFAIPVEELRDVISRLLSQSAQNKEEAVDVPR